MYDHFEQEIYRQRLAELEREAELRRLLPAHPRRHPHLSVRLPRLRRQPQLDARGGC